MIYDELGLPKEIGADDKSDSSRLAGIMTIFGFGQPIDLLKYIVADQHSNFKFVYSRHPEARKHDFSRDQTLCLVAGLWKQKHYDYVDLKYVDGLDWFSPSHKGHIKRCQGKKSNWFQDLWFWGDVLFHTYIKPLEEPNQLLSMMITADPKFLHFWLNYNKSWEKSIWNYWAGWRKEPELATHMIDYLLKFKRNPVKVPVTNLVDMKMV